MNNKITFRLGIDFEVLIGLPLKKDNIEIGTIVSVENKLTYQLITCELNNQGKEIYSELKEGL
jgi:hypothetical protein